MPKPRALRGHMTYANIVSSLALFLALGGVSWAATQLPKNSVGNKAIKKNAVTGSKIKKNSITSTKIKSGAINTSDVRNESITGAKVNEGSLGTVPVATASDTAKVSNTALDSVVFNTRVDSSASNIDPNVARAAATEIPIASHGQVSFYAKCFVDSDAPATYGEVYGRTTADGAGLDGYSASATFYGNPALDTSTAEIDRRIVFASTGANSVTTNYANEVSLTGPDGRGLLFDAFVWIKSGNPVQPPQFFTSGQSCVFQATGHKLG
ncbi:MAG: hypothetical protein Q7R41_00640 [Phycisphaerales bacterium]|nr:hypothetical protein [Phycisphaerales bacterium]